MLRLKTFGGLSLERDGAPVEGRVTQRRRLALLAYLAAAGETPSGREKLVALFWPERDAEHGRHSLSQAVYALRQELGHDALLGGIDEIRLNGAVVRSDLADFRAALSSSDLEAAVALYRGPFLDAVYVNDAAELERWVEAERQQLAAACAGALERLGAAAMARRDWPAAVDWWRQRVTLTPLDTRATLHLMKSLAAAGDGAGALRQARIHEQLLRADLDVGPDAQVVALAGQLRQLAGPAEPDTHHIAQRPESASALSPVPRVRRRRWSVLVLALLVPAALLATWAERSGWFSARGERPLVLLASFTGADSTLALAVREAIQAELAADAGVQLVPEGRVTEALRLMRLPANLPLRAPIALELARRVGAQIVVVGSVSALGSRVQVVVQALEPRDGATVVSLNERPEREEGVVEAVSRLGRGLRARLANTQPDEVLLLPAVTTKSLEALERYAEARQALRTSREAAVTLGEAALAHDSLFPLAHYLVGDLLWFVDQQAHSEAHLTRAAALAEQVPLRERLLIRARYEQLVQDRPDSALAYWQLLRASHRDEALAYEGMAWTLRALGRYREAAAAAETALQIDPSAVTPNVNNRLYALFSLGDTTAALASVAALPAGVELPRFEARFLTALQRHDWTGALAIVEPWTREGGTESSWLPHYRRHMALVAFGDLEEAAARLDAMEQLGRTHQAYPRSLIAQAMAEAERSRTAEAAALGRRALAWLDGADLSPQAVARIAERIAAVGVWSRDRELIAHTRRLLMRRDAGRGLRSYRLALLTIAGCAALVRGDGGQAAEQLAGSLAENFFGRSASTIALLRADALALAGDSAYARAIYRQIAAHAVPDTDFEAWPALGAIAARRAAQ